MLACNCREEQKQHHRIFTDKTTRAGLQAEANRGSPLDKQALQPSLDPLQALCAPNSRLPIGDHKSSGGIASIDIPAKSALHRTPMNLLYNLDQQGVHVGAHRNSLIDMYGKHGSLGSAHQVFEEMAEQDVMSWNVMVAGLAQHGCGKDVLELFEQLDDTEELINKMSLDTDSSVWNSVLDDRSHPQTEEIYAELDELTRQIKETGYVPDTHHVMHDFEEQQEEQVISQHSEKLVIAFGLMTTATGSPIHVIKNLGVYMDFHTAPKFISKVSGHESSQGMPAAFITYDLCSGNCHHHCHIAELSLTTAKIQDICKFMANLQKWNC
ncbi:unnamed protein product [Sphagnum troendelagicum]|uniref:DYW domain-containing protein n=1 Tax=Sphagnum troendelagicum TaxID=128251 RepID=A0ABP0UJY7_9BRYO